MKEPTDKYFVSVWSRYDRQHLDRNWNSKFIRIGSGQSRDDYPNLMMEYTNSDGSDRPKWYVKGQDEGCGTGGWTSRPYELPFGEWFQQKFQNDIGTAGIADGIINVWHNQFMFEQNDILLYRPECADRVHSNLWLGHWIKLHPCDPDICEYVEFWDDVYIDNTWQRIEICDLPNYGEAVHCEMQIPRTFWQDDELMFTANLGTFNTNEDMYLFVIDKEGVASEGFFLGVGSNLPPEPADLDDLPAISSLRELIWFGRAFGSPRR